MKALLLLTFCILVAGCDYTVPLATTPDLDRDPALIGLWQTKADDGKPQSLLVLPLGIREYLVSFPAGTSDAMFARAFLFRTVDRTLVQVEWIGTAAGKVPEDRRVYQYAAYTLTANELSLRLLNPDVVKRDAVSAGDLTLAMADHAKDSDAFRKPMVFTKTDR